MACIAKPLTTALTPEAIVVTAIRQADAAGLDRLTMRRLAAELSVTPMALYWHFANKNALIEAMAAHVVADLGVEDIAHAPWQERLRAVLGGALVVITAHPWLSGLRRRMVMQPSYLGVIETLLDAMHAAGYDEVGAVVAVDTALDTVATLAARLADQPDDSAAQDQATALSAPEQLRALGDAGYPRIAAAAQALTSPDPAVAQDIVVEILVRGIEAAAPGRSSD